eukprot:6204531-Pleurochrysis_carterae.AAC.2
MTRSKLRAASNAIALIIRCHFRESCTCARADSFDLAHAARRYARTGRGRKSRTRPGYSACGGLVVSSRPACPPAAWCPLRAIVRGLATIER